MKDDLTHLNKLASSATKGQWIAVGAWVENCDDNLPDIVCAPILDERGPNDSIDQRIADAEYIAAANPIAVKALISEIRRLRRRLVSGVN